MSRSHPIVPVLDLMIGQIVLAQGGKRDNYLPVNSKLSRSSHPLDVSKAIYQQTGCDTMYLADIDSFAGAEPNWRVFNQLLDSGVKLWIDADWLKNDQSKRITKQIRSLDQIKVIVSTETMSSLDDLDRLAELKSAGLQTIFSLDQVGDSVISKTKELCEISPLEWIQHAVTRGVNDIIVLDLAFVGTMRGIDDEQPISSLFQEIRNELPNVDLTSGGGVRSVDDVRRFLEFGCDHVLVASAIHQRHFTPSDIEQLSLRLFNLHPD